MVEKGVAVEAMVAKDVVAVEAMTATTSKLTIPWLQIEGSLNNVKIFLYYVRLKL